MMVKTPSVRAARICVSALLAVGALLATAPALAAANAAASTSQSQASAGLSAPELTHVCNAGSSITVFWEPVSGAAEYRVFVDGERLTAGIFWSSTSFEHFAPTPDKLDMVWTVAAVDDSGNVSPMSNGMKPSNFCDFG